MTQQEFDNQMALITNGYAAAQPLMIALSAEVLKGYKFPAGANPDEVAEKVANDPLIQALMSLGFRLARTEGAWEIGSLGNLTYWPKLPEITGGTAPGGGALTAETLLPLLMTILTGPSAGQIIDLVKKAVLGGSPVLPPV